VSEATRDYFVFLRYNSLMSDLVLGIDEAGRGCVIGPLVLAGFLIPEEDSLIARLINLGVNDSKLLLPDKREYLAQKIKKIAQGYKIAKVQPSELDKFSINDLEIKFSARLINHFSPARVYLDVPASGQGIKNYCNSVASLCVSPSKIIGANKMDSANVLVAAASILAKSERERQIKLLKKKYGNFGSGYPSDPKTIQWLKNWQRSHAEWPSIVRKKWNTLEKFQITNPKFQTNSND